MLEIIAMGRTVDYQEMTTVFQELLERHFSIKTVERHFNCKKGYDAFNLSPPNKELHLRKRPSISRRNCGF